MLASGATMSATGYFDSFTLMVILRVLLGLISSAFNPLSFSILAEIFPKEKRATINSILQSGNYIGWGLSSISILAINKFGWRYTYQILGALALFIAIICSLAVKDPK
jgi:MFS family permease